MNKNLTDLISKRISDLYTELTYFSDNHDENIVNYLNNLGLVKSWLPILSTIARIEITTNTKATLDNNLISRVFDNEYELEESQFNPNIISVIFTNCSKVSNHIESNATKYSGLSFESEDNCIHISNVY